MQAPSIIARPSARSLQPAAVLAVQPASCFPAALKKRCPDRAARDGDGNMVVTGRITAAWPEQKNGMTNDDKNGVDTWTKKAPLQAVCGKAACTDSVRGRSAMSVPTANTCHDPISEAIRLRENFWASHVEAVKPAGKYLGAHRDGGVQARDVGYDAGVLRQELFVDLPGDRARAGRQRILCLPQPAHRRGLRFQVDPGFSGSQYLGPSAPAHRSARPCRRWRCGNARMVRQPAGRAGAQDHPGAT